MVEISNIQKRFGSEEVLKGISASIAPNEQLTVLGKSGCGKSTFLKILAGLETADAGEFRLDGVDMLTKQARDRGVVYLSQEPLLFPHLSVRKNLAYGLEIRKEGESSIRENVEQMAAALQLTEHLDKMPQQLSGGQKQRVNFGRSLIIKPKMLLLDEPFGSLDSTTRADMQQFLISLRKKINITSILVTHDIKEAIILGDRISRMENGKLEIYTELKEFLADARTGANDEISFWEKMKNL